MNGTVRRILAAGVALGLLAACAPVTGPPGVPSSSNVNPETGSRGGSGSSH
jgi:hypothetical protein